MFSAPVRRFNSSTDPTQTISSKSSDTQSGIGLPQKRDLEKHQSLTFDSHVLKRPSYANLGT